MGKEYYRKNKEEWKKGGKYYYYKPKVITGKLTIARGKFVLSFN
tara:strand:- start:249 stop:380 length:132 start_codon:yes stop_codon:yes gene_type:complete